MKVRALWLAFILTIVLPGLLLTYFGLRALRQDRLSADRQIRDRMDQFADETIIALEKAIESWQDALDRWAADGGERPAGASEPIRRIMERPGSGVLISRGIDGLRVFPSSALAYWPQADIGREPSAPLPAELAAADSLELKDRNYTRSIEVYKGLLTSAPRYRSWLLLRLARCYRGAGLRNEALTCFRELQKDTAGALGSRPARLIASAEICSLFAETGPPESLASEALSTYRELIEGVWRLDKYQYAYYSDKLRGWLEAGPPSGEFLQWRSQEAQKLALSSAADQLLQNPQRVIRTDAGPALAIWRAEPFAGLVLAPGHFGADDYITKPFSSRELKARIKAVLRRTSPSAKDGRSEKVFEFGNVRVDFDKFELRRKGRKIELTALEFKLLRAFLAHRGKLLSIDQLFAEVWDKDACLTDRVIYTHVNNLRNKIEDDPSHPRFLIGVRGLGYRFDG